MKAILWRAEVRETSRTVGDGLAGPARLDLQIIAVTRRDAQAAALQEAERRGLAGPLGVELSADLVLDATDGAAWGVNATADKT